MKANRQIFSIIITKFLVLFFSLSIPIVSVSSVAPLPNQFIAEVFPNKTLPLQLSHTNTIIIFNATDFPNKIDIHFDGNYTIYNPENTTTIPAILPFSLATNITDFTFDVYANETLIPYDLISISPWIENITEIVVHLAYFIEVYPIILIRSNITLPENSSSVIRYHFSGSISNPLESSDLFYMVYHLGTSREWIGNTTGRVELKAYGKQPIFSRGGVNFATCQLVNINGGRSYSCEWNNTKSPWMDIGIRYYREGFDDRWGIILFNLLAYFVIATVIIRAVIIRRKRKRIKSL